ncbi:type II secretion system protein [Chitinimonas viridis]|uniref:Type II secretion system protein n=1 Tax=Chitinimonas viridis TaxID=664880 RepID=A0ABT8B7F0_9NEIS|nr:type II secretion system protein [Chitinimonas viridis]MDN3578073.1 type II secretion system protein [Chitinimonas viridis]
MSRLVRQQGFSLLEAIVALVIVSTVGMLAIAWINSSFDAQFRLKEQYRKQVAMADAIEFTRSINPAIRPFGKAPLRAFRLEWESKPIAGPLDGSSYPRGSSSFAISVHKVDVTVYRDARQPWFTFTVNQVGYKRTKDYTEAFGGNG